MSAFRDGEARLMLVLVTGPVRSGKSARAAALARAAGRPVVFAATLALDAGDAEMRERVARHTADRPPGWRIIETGAPGAKPLREVVRDAPSGVTLVVDALGTWLGALMLGRDDDDPVALQRALDAEGEALIGAFATCSADLIVVAEETGWGVVPPTTAGRVFRDALGRLTRRAGELADRVELVVAGFAIDVRALGVAVDEVP